MEETYLENFQLYRKWKLFDEDNGKVLPYWLVELRIKSKFDYTPLGMFNYATWKACWLVTKKTKKRQMIQTKAVHEAWNADG